MVKSNFKSGIDVLEQIVNERLRLLEKPTVELYHDASSATYSYYGHRKKGRPKKGQQPQKITETVGRSAKENAIIYQQQKKVGRNPWFLTAKELRKVTAVVQRYLPQMEKDYKSTVDRMLREAGKIIYEMHLQHIEDGRNKRGQMKPLKRGYEERKERIFREEKPILVYSGAFKDSLKWRKKRTK